MTSIYELAETERRFREYEDTLENEPEDYGDMDLDELQARGLELYRNFPRRWVGGIGGYDLADVRISGDTLRGTKLG